MYDAIKKNNFLLFESKNSIVTNKSKQNIVSLQAKRCLYANLHVAYQSRGGYLDNFLLQENHLYRQNMESCESP